MSSTPPPSLYVFSVSLEASDSQIIPPALLRPNFASHLVVVPIAQSQRHMNIFSSLAGSFRRYRFQGVVSCSILALEGYEHAATMI
jgi:hypothetical protein